MGWKWALILLGLTFVIVVFLLTLLPRRKPMASWEKVREIQGSTPSPSPPPVVTRPQDPWRTK